jgi:predicted lactoylglutathione lyase
MGKKEEFLENNDEKIEKIQRMAEENNVVQHFLQLMNKYSNQREHLETDWDESLRVYFNDSGMDKVYDGYSNIRIPEADKKVNSVVARVESILFNVNRIGRIEAERTSMIDPDIVELQNKYIFENQLDDIRFRHNYHIFNLLQTIQGSAVAEITQEYEVKEINNQEVVIKDNTFFRPRPLKAFFSDITKANIQDSRANILSTEMSLEEIKRNRKKIVTETFEVQNEFGEVTEVTETREEGFFFNVDMIDPDGLSYELEDYLQVLGISETSRTEFTTLLNNTKKTGMVSILKCYGLLDLDGNGEKEYLAIIANNNILIRLEETPFKHRRYVRPFVFGVYKPTPLMLYGESNVIKGLQLIKELNASRTQVTDSKALTVFPMTYINTTGGYLDWDGKWRPGGVIKGVGNNPIQPIVNPNLSDISINDSTLIQRDLDELWAIAPIQQGISDRRYLPETASATNALIAQGEYVLDNIVSQKVENELMPFFEMLFERNLTFKTVDQMAIALTEEEIQRLDLTQAMNMDQLVFIGTVKILGNMKLSKERSTQAGYERLLQLTQEIPNLARRIDYRRLTEKLLESYGIKDDADELFIPEDTVQEQLAQEQAAQQAIQQLQQLAQQQQQQLQKAAQEMDKLQKQVDFQNSPERKIIDAEIEIEKETRKLEAATEEATKRKLAEAAIEQESGSKVN